jgi:hypothetical protein
MTIQEWLDEQLAEGTRELTRHAETQIGHLMLLNLVELLELLEGQTKLKLFADKNPDYARGRVDGIRAVGACLDAVLKKRDS